MYSSMWIIKPNQGKTSEVKEMIKKMCEHWKKHGAIEANGGMLFGSDYGHLCIIVRCESMEHYGKCNDALVTDSKVQETLAEGENLCEVTRHTFARRFT